MPRKVVDCRDYPSEANCSIMMSGEEEEVVRAAAEHASKVHGHEDTPELRDQIRKSLKDEPKEWLSPNRIRPLSASGLSASL